MKVSVLVLIYGVEHYIAQCAESLFLQTYENIEYSPFRLTNAVAKAVAAVMRSSCPMGIASLLYRMLRKVFEVKVRLFS